MLLTEPSKFKTDGTPIFCQPYGSGHINTTFLVLDTTARLYILQKINKNVFRNPQAVMSNIEQVCAHLKKKGCGFREALSLIVCHDGKMVHVDDNGDYWRMYAFISDSVAFQAPGDNGDGVKIMNEAGLATGQFLGQLSDFDASKLVDTIPNFHNTPMRYEALNAAISQDRANRAASVKAEIDFALSRSEFANTLIDLQKSGVLPTKVTHNDTKLNNILFDRETRKAICVIDLDTIMPGLLVNDFGDAIRFGANTATEDEQDLSKVSFSLELYRAYAEGFLDACGNSLNVYEIMHLPTGAKMMTLECGVRFLTDYLNGDEYFKIHHPMHNLDRCRVQFKLVEEMEMHWNEMRL